MVFALDYEGTGGSAPLENDKMRLIAFQFCQMECFKKKECSERPEEELQKFISC